MYIDLDKEQLLKLKDRILKYTKNKDFKALFLKYLNN
jgi:hypothetical protein